MNNKIILVLGMHRSGTSWLAGSLECAGVNLGNVSNYNKFNQKGNKENDEIMKMHEDLIKFNGFEWHNCKGKLNYEKKNIKFLKNYFENLDGKYVGFKDPRTMFFYDSFKENFNNIIPIGIFRDPIKSAGSIKSRDKHSIEDALETWYNYNKLLLEYSIKDNIPLINFDEGDLKFFLLDKFCILNSICFNQKYLNFEDINLYHQKNDQNLNLNIEKYNNLYFDLIEQSIINFKK